MSNHPGMIAATIAGSSIGFATGVIRKGEQLENQGATLGQQFGGSIVGGITSGLTGAGIGLGTSGTIVALKSILKK